MSGTCEIVLLSADGVGTNEIMRKTGKSIDLCVAWQERFMQAGYAGSAARQEPDHRASHPWFGYRRTLVALTRTDPPVEATHWTAAMMAKAVGISASSVQRIWLRHGLHAAPGRQFKLSTDPKFIDKLRDFVGLYIDPPAHASSLRSTRSAKSRTLTAPSPACQ